MALGREIVHVGDIGQRQALVLQQMHQFDGCVTVNPRVGRETAHLLADLREILRRDAEFVGIVAHLAVLAIVATLQHPDEVVHHLSHLCRDVSITLDSGMTLVEVDEQLLLNFFTNKALNSMKEVQLRAVCDNLGITYKNKVAKTAMIAAIIASRRVSTRAYIFVLPITMVSNIKHSILLHCLNDGLKIVLARRHVFQNDTVFYALTIRQSIADTESII